MVVYVEYVIIDNLVIDSLILYTTKMLGKLKSTKLKIFLSALIGTLFAFITPHMSTFFNLLLKPMLAVIMIYVAFTPKKIKQFLICYLLFFISTFAYGGAFIGICEMLGIKFLIQNGTYYEYKFPVGLAVFICEIMYISLKNAIKYCYQKHSSDSLEYNIKFYINNISAECKAYLDTGNNLTMCGKPITIIDYKIFAKLFPKISIIDILQKKYIPLNNYKYIEFESISGEPQKILTFDIDRIEIESKKINNAKLGLSFKNLSETNCDCIISKKIIYGDDK